jgi:hypothetical protein
VTETADERAERLLAVGLDVAVQIRDDDPEAVARLLQALDRTEMRDLVMVLAAAVDINVPVTMLYGWLGLGDPQRCGTQRAVSRHRRRGEKLDVACLAFDAKRKQRGRVAA